MSDDKKRKFKIAPELQKALDEKKAAKEEKPKKVFKTKKNLEAASKIKSFLKGAIEKSKAKKTALNDKLNEMLETRKAYSDSIRDFGSGETSWMFKSQVKHYVDLLANLDKEANNMGYKYSYVRGKYIPIKKSKPE
jgi:predicted  nucleic acid-binding Zn-ribbon protein